MEQNQIGPSLAQNTLDQIPSPAPNARRITALVKQRGKVVGYQLSDHTTLGKQQAVELARQGGIAGVGIAHRGDTEYLKSIPDGSEQNNLSSLPSIPSARFWGNSASHNGCYEAPSCAGRYLPPLPVSGIVFSTGFCMI